MKEGAVVLNPSYVIKTSISPVEMDRLVVIKLKVNVVMHVRYTLWYMFKSLLEFNEIIDNDIIDIERGLITYILIMFQE